jgi:hypothetical protein
MLLGDVLRTSLFDFPGVRGVQAYATYASRFIEEIVGGARSVSRHYGSCGQGKAQGVGLILEI